MPKAKNAEPTFEGILERMEAIATELESGDPQLEQALQLFEEGVKLSKVGTARLDAAEKKLEILLDNDDVAEFGASADRE